MVSLGFEVVLRTMFFEVFEKIVLKPSFEAPPYYFECRFMPDPKIYCSGAKEVHSSRCEGLPRTQKGTGLGKRVQYLLLS